MKRSHIDARHLPSSYPTNRPYHLAGEPPLDIMQPTNRFVRKLIKQMGRKIDGLAIAAHALGLITHHA